MILEKNNFQTVQEWTNTYIELIASYAHIKNSNHLQSHLRDITALDHSRLGLETNSCQTNQAEIFCIWQVYLPTNLGRVYQPFMLFIHHIWGETVLWGIVFIIQTSDRMQYFTILQYKLHSLTIQDDGSIDLRFTIKNNFIAFIFYLIVL